MIREGRAMRLARPVFCRLGNLPHSHPPDDNQRAQLDRLTARVLKPAKRTGAVFRMAASGRTSNEFSPLRVAVDVVFAVGVLSVITAEAGLGIGRSGKTSAADNKQKFDGLWIRKLSVTLTNQPKEPVVQGGSVVEYGKADRPA